MIDSPRRPTVDNGITARNEVAQLLQTGIQVIATDPKAVIPVHYRFSDSPLRKSLQFNTLVGWWVAFRLRDPQFFYKELST